MLILAIDTSHKQGSVCLARGDTKSFELIGTAEVDGGMFSAQLVPVIARLLAKHDLKKTDLQGVAAAVGPGSFTGLRIGLAAVKGFAEVLQVPIVAVSTLEAVAASVDVSGEVIAVLDAGRKEFYIGQYSGSVRKREMLLTREELVNLLSNVEVPLISPDEAVREIAAARLHPIPYPGAAMIARIGVKKLAAGECVPLEALDANYVRRDENLFAPAK
jgi:tRNA threonylcarbamoyladenosine biosynthesis protein TsaB